jgi:hypothetical protein
MEGRFEGEATANLSFELAADSGLEVILLDRTLGIVTAGSTDIRGRLSLESSAGRLIVTDPSLQADEDSGGTIWTLESNGLEVFKMLSSGLAVLDLGNDRLRWDNVDLVVGEGLAEVLGLPSATGQRIGSVALEAVLVSASRSTGSEAFESHPVTEGGENLGIGPDVIVGDLPGTNNYGTSGGIRAYSVATTSCNIGNQPLDWIAGNNRHPVIGQNLYRLENGRIQQIGMSWLKHGFFALSGSLCFNDCQGTDGSELGVHCSDPYSSGLNGDRGGLGPKYQVNASTGVFTYPPTQPASDGTIGRRLQVLNTDVDPAAHPTALYYVEGHYITPDDAQSGNGNNNASYRRVNVSASTRNLSVSGQTFQQIPAVMAWKAADPSVTASTLDIPLDGRFHVLSKATDLGGGRWHYEYAILNLNSHRSGQAITIRLPEGHNVSNIGFYDIAHHSGEPFSTADWSATTTVDSIVWSTQTFAVNQNANAHRWGTTFNYWFDVDAAPQTERGTLTAFRPAAQMDYEFTAIVPTAGPRTPLPDLSIPFVFVDYDPTTTPINNGPGGIGQALNAVVRVRNTGNTPITSASFQIDTNVMGAPVLTKTAIVTDFGAAAGVQPLQPNTNYDVIFNYAAGELDRCGTYTLIASHDAANLMSLDDQGMPVVGDTVSTNDQLRDYPKELNHPDDDQSPDLLELRFGTFNISVTPESVIIENPATEKLKLRIVYNGLGPGGDSHDVRLDIDLLNASGTTVLYPAALSVSRMDTRSSGMKTVNLRVDMSGVAPGEYRARLTLFDENSGEACIQTSSVNTTMVQ